MIRYYPYFRGKAAELKAVATVAKTLVSNGRIMPIFEPVNVKTGPAVKHFGVAAAAGLRSALVLNPRVGDLMGNWTATVALYNTVAQANTNAIVPALIVTDATTLAEVHQFRSVAPSDAVFVHEGAPKSPVIALLQGQKNVTHLFHDGATTVAHQSTFGSRGLLRDGFRAAAKNAAYPHSSFFGDLHLTYKNAGLGAFGEFSIVGHRFFPSGGPAYAVAIHMTENATTHIQCNHFISASNSTSANPGGKFAEAVSALAAYTRANPGKLDFSDACQTFLAHDKNGHYPGLTDVKTLSLQHHLELMAKAV